MTSITPTYSVRIDPRHSTIWSRPEDVAEQAKFSRLAAEGRDDEVVSRLHGAAMRQRLHMRDVAAAREIREQAI